MDPLLTDGKKKKTKKKWFFSTLAKVPSGSLKNLGDKALNGRGPGTNSSQSKNVGKIQLSMQLSHLSIILVILINSNFWHGSS